MADCGIRKWLRRGRLSRIFASFAVDMVKLLGLRIVEFHLVVSDGPRGRASAVMPDRTEVFFAKPEESSAVELGIAADVVVRMRMKFFAVAVPPSLFRLILALQVDSLAAPVVFLAWNIAAALQN